jgi:hypothetical protein
MSLINDALKRAHESQGKEPAPAPPPMAPVASPPAGGFGWFLPAAGALLLVVAGLLIWLALAHRSSKPAAPPAVATVAPAMPSASPAPSVPPAPVAAAPAAIAPPSVTTNTAPADNPTMMTGLLPERLPKVQGIIFSQPPTAIVNGKVVYVGDRVGHFLVKQITQNKVIFQRDDGSVKQLGVGE